MNINNPSNSSSHHAQNQIHNNQNQGLNITLSSSFAGMTPANNRGIGTMGNMMGGGRGGGHHHHQPHAGLVGSLQMHAQQNRMVMAGGGMGGGVGGENRMGAGGQGTTLGLGPGSQEWEWLTMSL